MTDAWNYESDNEAGGTKPKNSWQNQTEKSHSRSVSPNRSDSGRHNSQSPPLPSTNKPTGANRNRQFNNKNNQKAEPSSCVGVFGLSKRTDEDQLNEIFKNYGEIVSVKLIMDKFQKESMCYGFINYEDQESAERAIAELSGTEIDGKMIRVDFSYTKKAHTPTPGMYKGKRKRNDDFGGNKRDFKRKFDDRSRSRSFGRRRSPMRCLGSSGDRRGFRGDDRRDYPSGNDYRGSSNRRGNDDRYSRGFDGRNDHRRFSPLRDSDLAATRNEIRRYSPSRRYSPVRHESRRFSPPRHEPRRYGSPPMGHRSESRRSPMRTDYRRFSPPRNEARRYSPMPMRSESRRYSPPRPEQRRYSPPRNIDSRRFSPPRNLDSRRLSPPRNSDFRSNSQLSKPTFYVPSSERNSYGMKPDSKYSPARNDDRFF